MTNNTAGEKELPSFVWFTEGEDRYWLTGRVVKNPLSEIRKASGCLESVLAAYERYFGTPVQEQSE